MTQQERLYTSVLNLVEEQTDMAEEAILRSTTEQSTDARYMLIGVLSGYLTDIEIAKFTGLSRSCVNKLRNGMRRRADKYAVRSCYRTIVNAVRSLFGEQ